MNIQFPLQPQYRNILPLTFDDSLTYYEQMLNLYKIITECYKDLETIKTELGDIVGAEVDLLIGEKTPAIIKEANNYTDNKVSTLQSAIKNLTTQIDIINNKITQQYQTITNETDHKIKALQNRLELTNKALNILSEKVNGLDNLEDELYNKLLGAIVEYMQELSLEVYMWSPVTSNYEPIESVTADVFNYGRYGQFSASEYDSMHYTAGYCDKKKLTVRQWLTNVKHFWLFRQLQKVFDGFTGNQGDGRETLTHLTDWMKPYPISAGNYDHKQMSASDYDNNNITAYNYDFNGSFETEGFKDYKRIDSVRDIPMVEMTGLDNRVSVIERDLDPMEAGSLANVVDRLGDLYDDVKINVDTINYDIGDVNTLITEDKVVVKAINWLKQQFEALKNSIANINTDLDSQKLTITQNTNNIGDMYLLETDNKTSLVGAINELHHNSNGTLTVGDVEEIKTTISGIYIGIGKKDDTTYVNLIYNGEYIPMANLYKLLTDEKITHNQYLVLLKFLTHISYSNDSDSDPTIGRLLANNNLCILNLKTMSNMATFNVQMTLSNNETL